MPKLFLLKKNICKYYETWCWAFISVGVGNCQSEDPFVLAWNPHKGLACKISFETGIGRRKKGPRAEEKESVKRSGQNRAVNRRDQGREQTSWQNRTVSRREQELGLWTQAGLANMRRWVSIPSGFEGILLEYMLTLVHRSTEC